MVIVAVLLIVVGYSQIAYKDAWWWDIQLLSRFGVGVQRNAAWERQQNLWGAIWVLAGLAGLVYYTLGYLVI